MKKIIDNKLYDTEKAKKIVDFKTKVEHKTLFGSLYPYHKASIFKTDKGTYLKYIGKPEESSINYDNYEKLEVISEDKVKKLLIDINDVDAYISEFGEVEEG